MIQGLHVLVPRRSWRALGLWIAAATVAGFTVAGALKQPPEVAVNAGWGVLAAEQAARGMGGTPVAVRMADPSDLSQSKQIPITWVAPSSGWTPYVFRSLGLNMGEALRAVFLGAWALAVAGWIGVFRMAGLRGARLAAVALVFAATRFIHANAAIYEGEDFLLLAVFPWALLLTLFAWRPASKVDAAGFSFSAGLFLPALGLVKHGATVAAVVVAIAWLFQTARGGVPWKRTAIFALGGGAGLLLLDAWGNLGANGVIASIQDPAARWDGLWSFAWLPLAPTDLDAMLRWLLLHPARPVPQGETILAGCGGLLLLGLLTLALVAPSEGAKCVSVTVCPPSLQEKWSQAWWAFRRLTPPQMLALVLALILPAVLVALAFREEAAVLEPRDLRLAALPGLAVVFGWLLDRWRSGRAFSCGLAFALLGALYAVPLFYGAATLLDKTFFRAPIDRNLVGSCGVRLDDLAPEGNARDFHEDLQRIAGGRRAVFWLPTPMLATELVEERLIVTQASFQAPTILAKLKYRGRPEGGVVVVYPEAFAKDGRLACVLRAFRDLPSAGWQFRKLPRCPGWNAAVNGEP
ncbi:MAG: hypothetical protein IT578_12130 [Verrucomicrobiae bacterium]|nr:hypothetical protein [Verrucomicrobiae bacterium]